MQRFSSKRYISGKEKDAEYTAPKSQKLTDLDEETAKDGKDSEVCLVLMSAKVLVDCNFRLSHRQSEFRLHHSFIGIHCECC